MAIKKCKECGRDVSTKAAKCPHCGVKIRQKTLVMTWIVLILVVFFVITAQQESEYSRKSAAIAIESSKAKLAEKKVSAPKSGWTVSSSKDKMTGDTIFFAHSKVAYPSPKMEFPYSDINGWMGV